MFQRTERERTKISSQGEVFTTNSALYTAFSYAHATICSIIALIGSFVPSLEDKYGLVAYCCSINPPRLPRGSLSRVCFLCFLSFRTADMAEATFKRRREKYSRLICLGCRSRRIRCVLPDITIVPSSEPQTPDKACQRCAQNGLDCVVDYTTSVRYGS